MRILVSFALVSAVWAQIYVYDVDGRKVLLPSPDEKRQRKVIEDGPGGKVIEETIERKDVNGNRLPPEKVRTVERTAADGSKVTETTVMQRDLNGNLVPTERTTQTVQKQGAQTFTTSVVERPSVSGGFAAVEKVSSQTVTANGKDTTTRSTFVRDANGNYSEAVRELVERTKEGEKGSKEVTKEFRNAPTGKMEMTGQRVVVERVSADGSKESEVSIYGPVAQGRTSDGTLKLREQQLVTTRSAAGNTVVESISVRRPDLSDSRMGAYQKVGEKVTTLPPGAKP